MEEEIKVGNNLLWNNMPTQQLFYTIEDIYYYKNEWYIKFENLFFPYSIELLIFNNIRKFLV